MDKFRVVIFFNIVLMYFIFGIKIIHIITVQKRAWLFSLHCSQSKEFLWNLQRYMSEDKLVKKGRNDCPVCQWVFQRSTRPPTSPLSAMLCQHTTSANSACSESISSDSIMNFKIRPQWIYCWSCSILRTKHYSKSWLHTICWMQGSDSIWALIT